MRTIEAGLSRRPVLGFGLALLLLVGCAAPVTRDLDTPPLVWPAAPATARFRLEPPLIALEIPSGFFGRIGRAILGTPRGLRFERPTGLAFTATGELAIVDQGVNRVYVCDLEGKIRHEVDLGRAGIEEAVDVVVTPDQTLYVSDPRRGRVVRFEGKNLREFRAIEVGGRPTSLGYDATRGIVLAVDTVTPAILSIDHASFELLPFAEKTVAEEGAAEESGPAPWNRPVWITSSRTGGAWIVDALNFRVCRIDLAGSVRLCFGQLGDGPGTFARPRGVAEDDASRVYVVDALFGNCQIFDENGRLLLAIGARGSGPGEMLLPSDIAIWGDTIAIADSYNRRIQFFRRLPPPPGEGNVAAREKDHYREKERPR